MRLNEMETLNLFLNPEAKLVLIRAAVLDTGSEDVSNARLLSFIELAETNLSFRQALTAVVKTKAISPFLIEKAAKLANKHRK